MAKYFLGSVGQAEAFRVVYDAEAGKNKLVLAFVAKTLTDSSVSISTTKDELRGGTGASVQATFQHDPSVTCTLTDVFYRSEYITAQLGAEMELGSAEAYQTEEITATQAGKLELAKLPVALPLACTGDSILIWYTEKGKNEWVSVSQTIASKTVDATGVEANKTYCVRYLANDDAAREMIITSNITPQELVLVITTPLYAGDSCAASKSSIAGYITYEIPRFKLDGAQDFSNSMSSNTTMSLSGSALAADDSCSPVDSVLLKIKEVKIGRAWYEDIKGFTLDTLDHVDYPAGEKLDGHIYAIGAYGVSKLGSGDVARLNITSTTANLVENGVFNINASANDPLTIAVIGANITSTVTLK